MNIIVQKYGGTSVGSIPKIKSVADRILRAKATGAAMVVVVSAMGHTTDRLVNLARAITRKPSRREMDMLLSTGEQIFIGFLSLGIQERGAKGISRTGSHSGIAPNAN